MVADFSKKGNRKFFNSELLFRTAGILILFAIFVLIFVDFKMYQKKQQLAAQINAYQKQIEDIKKSSQTLKNEIANSDNIDYLEKLGYEQFAQTRPGETEYMFINSPKKIGITSKPENFWDVKFWQSWLENGFSWIKNKF